MPAQDAHHCDLTGGTCQTAGQNLCPRSHAQCPGICTGKKLVESPIYRNDRAQCLRRYICAGAAGRVNGRRQAGPAGMVNGRRQAGPAGMVNGRRQAGPAGMVNGRSQAGPGGCCRWRGCPEKWSFYELQSRMPKSELNNSGYHSQLQYLYPETRAAQAMKP